MKSIQLAIFLAIAGTMAATTAFACDLCGCGANCACEMGKLSCGPSIGVFEQFTHFATAQNNGVRTDNPTGQYLDSFITQFTIGYQFNDRIGLQLGVSYIYRKFRRPEGFAIDEGSESGLGDVTLVANARVFQRAGKDADLFVNLIGGIKFPTGNSDRIKEEFNEMGGPEAPESGIHGHDLALGSGSYDGIIGGAVFGRWNRLYATARLQYSIRTEGDFGYRYANDLTWDGGPGVFLRRNDTSSLGLQCNLSGETKGKDTFQGAPSEDTSVTTLFVGPGVSFTYGERIRCECGVDIPVIAHNTAFQIVPDYRIRASVTWKF